MEGTSMQRFALLALFALSLLVGCTQSKVVLGGDDGGTDAGMDDGGPITCGTNICGAGEYCCNESCGTCAPIGAGCAAVECVHTCGGDVCADDTGNLCCADCDGSQFCPGPGGTCPAIACPPVCADGTPCDGTCCPSPGCDDGFYCAAPGEMCDVAGDPVVCPNVCPDGSACADGATCCPGCRGEFFCSPDGASCPDISCPPPCDDGVFCETGLCCDDCRGSSYCSADGACEPCTGECAPFDARGVGACAAFFGYSWNGSECVGISGCDCAGTDCGRLYDSPDECLFEQWSCTTPPSCSSDADCGATEYCDGCATSSCPVCDDCVAGCVPHGCMSEREPICRAERPECGPDGIAIVRDGCWVCVDARTCEDLGPDDCRAAGCPGGSTCTACAVGEYVCLPDGEACAF